VQRAHHALDVAAEVALRGSGLGCGRFAATTEDEQADVLLPDRPAFPPVRRERWRVSTSSRPAAAGTFAQPVEEDAALLARVLVRRRLVSLSSVSSASCAPKPMLPL
jgi:hypothetical protein